MSEYIRREDALDAFGEEYVPRTDFERGMVSQMSCDKEKIKALPSADVAQVVHGRWIKYTGMGKVQWMCSECSAEEKNPKVANYCYHCGAKMDAQGEE